MNPRGAFAQLLEYVSRLWLLRYNSKKERQ